MASEESRFEIVTRRAFVQRSLLAGAAVLVGGGALAACGGNDDAKTFDSGDASTTGASAAATTAAAAGTTAAAAAAPAGDPLPAAAELQVAFTFASASDGRPAKNPYIAVWVENAAGEMVQTVSLWIQTGGKGQRYWRELTRWYGQEAKRVSSGGKATADTITGATRTAGDYSVAWDGTDYSGARVGQGQYWLCIEASREHGPYELIREQLTLGTEAFDKALTAKGELTAATVTYVA